MATLVSPGVSVSLTNESFYATAGASTVPLVIFATAANKTQSGTSAIATGTTAANAGVLYRLTSQRDVLQTFGKPTYYSAGGTQQYGNELNEHGLFALYQYLGQNNTAYALRADLDTSQLIPSKTAPQGAAANGAYWQDTSLSTWGIFRSNGNINSALAWQSYSPTVITSTANLESFVQTVFATAVTSSATSVISTGGSLVVNGIVIPVTTSDTIVSITSKINSNTYLAQKQITATIYAQVGKYSPTASTYGDIYNIRIVSALTTQPVTLVGTTGSVITDLGLTSTTPTNIVAPASSFGSAGDLAVDTISVVSGNTSPSNQIWEKINQTTSLGITAWWYKVGSNSTNYSGFGWKEALPRTIVGTVANPTFTAGDTFTIKIGTGSLLTVTVPSSPTLATVVDAINTQLNSSSGTNAVASVLTSGANSYLKITNYDGTDILLKDVDDQSQTHHPLRNAGIFATQTYFGSVSGTVTNPTFVAATLLTSSAVVSAAGAGYQVGNTLTVTGGTNTQASTLTVASIKLVSTTIAAGGTGYAVNDTLTFSGAGYASPVILKVATVSGGAITSTTIQQAGQYTGSVPSNPVSVASTSGSGSGAGFNFTWGVSTVTVATAGNYTVYPSNPVSITGGSGSGATFTLTPGFLTSNAFTVDAGSGPVLINVPASPNSNLAGVIAAINTAFASGPIVASNVNNCLVITNTNGTNFTLQDVSGTPLTSAGIQVGVTFGRQLTYQGYSPTLTVPSSLASLANSNIWINTTPSDLGAAYVMKENINGTWTKLNTLPNTGTIPMYSSDAAANVGFGANKAIGSVYVRYNFTGTANAQADHMFLKWDGSAWSQFVYTPAAVAPLGSPVAGTYWYNSFLQADVMVSTGSVWKGYRNVYPATDPTGIILNASAPTTQSDLTPLVDYDLWLDTSDALNYPAIYRYTAASATWTLVNSTDHSSPGGIIFADARPNVDGTKTGSSATKDLVLSDYVDDDAPNAQLYPAGLMLFNTRFSTNNVKVWTPNYLPVGAAYRDRWVTASGNDNLGRPYMGRYAQRQIVVEALNAVIVANEAIRAEQNFFNLIACPGYPETIEAMVNLNVDKKQVAFVLGDCPSHLAADGTSIQAWATNSADAIITGDAGLTVAADYTSLHYPWGLATNIDGNEVFAPATVAALVTFSYNDQVAYPWFAPAGFNRGIVTVFSSVGYLDSNDNYIPVVLNQGQRDVLYTNNINPIAYIPNKGLVIFGQKTLSPTSSAMDRINVARLMNYLNYNLDLLGMPFLFQQNDAQTRAAVTAVFANFMGNLVGLRGLYDYAVDCSSDNNSADRIDRNELWVDVAIRPEKSVEFIFIPVRLLNTGDPLPGAVQN